MLQRLSQLLLCAGLAFGVVSISKKDALPPAGQVQQAVLQEPDQRPTQRSAFQTTVGDVTYDVKPLYHYELHGLVVSRHDSQAWWDYIHKAWNDKLNVADLCVVWGNNIRNEAYQALSFSSGQFVCYVESKSQEDFARFDATALSNNHLLTADARLAKRIQNVRVGDQVRFSGYLAEYSHNHGVPFMRGTSTVRTDTGNGACETVFVEDFEVLRRGGGPWPTLLVIAGVMLALGVITWFAAPVRARD